MATTRHNCDHSKNYCRKLPHTEQHSGRRAKWWLSTTSCTEVALGHGREIWQHTWQPHMESKLIMKITHKFNSSINAMLFDLFHGRSLVLGGYKIYIDEIVLPVPVRKSDHILWTFNNDVRVSITGPDTRLISAEQYRDRIEFSVWWGRFVVEFE